MIENTFGMWKARFAVIQGVLRHDLSTCAKIIIATACLHNFAVSDGDFGWIGVMSEAWMIMIPLTITTIGHNSIGKGNYQVKKIRCDLIRDHFT